MENQPHPISQPILVTGATGMIGSALVRRLIKEEKEVHVFVLPYDNIPIAWEGKVHIHWGDISEFRYVEKAIEACHTIFHMAALVGDWGSRQLFQRINVDGTNHVLELANSQNKRVIITTGVAVYGSDLQRFVCTEERPHGEPVGYYSQSLQAQERIAQKFILKKNLPCTIVRPSTVYGPGGRTWVYGMLDAIKAGPTILGDGNQNAGLVHVDNVVEMLLTVARSPKSIGQVYNICDEDSISWKTYQTDLAKAAKLPLPRSFPKEIAWTLGNIQEWIWKGLNLQDRPHFTLEAVNRIMSNHRIPIDKVKKDLGYKPLKTYSEGIKELKEYLKLTYLKKD
ncbi:MAG: NAD(P)-dependent oxidoreductase [Bacteroidia bacterium]|nr:NAD(P)-dependent oxidoreductase [Bacteroidia bacterium]